MRILQSIAILFWIISPQSVKVDSINGIACDQSAEVSDTIYVDQELKTYVSPVKGSWWIYKKVGSQNTFDTVKVTNRSGKLLHTLESPETIELITIDKLHSVTNYNIDSKTTENLMISEHEALSSILGLYFTTPKALHESLLLLNKVDSIELSTGLSFPTGYQIRTSEGYLIWIVKEIGAVRITNSRDSIGTWELLTYDVEFD